MVASNYSQVFAQIAFKKGGLVLLPFGTITLLPQEKVTKGSCVVLMAGMKSSNALVVQNTKCDFKKGTGNIVPFFWLKETKEEKQDNMQKAQVKHGDLTIPCAKNKVALAAGSALFLESLEPAKKAKK